MAATVLSNSNSGAINASSASWSHTIGSGSNLVLVVLTGCAAGSPPNVSSVTYGAQSLSQVASSAVTQGVVRSEIWRLPNGTQPSGNQTVTVTMGAACELYCGAVVAKDANQTTALGTAVTNSAAANAARSVTVTSATDEVAVAANVGSITGSGSLTSNAGTEYWNLTNGANTSNASGGSITGSASAAFSWTNFSAEDWAASGVSIKPTGAAPTAALTGTATSSITEADIVTGGKTVILTLTGDTWVPASAGAITYVGGQVGQFAGKTSTTTVTFGLTGGLAATPAAGDLVIVSYAVGSGTATDRALTITNATPTNYTLIDAEQYQNDTFSANLRVAYRFMPGTPETTCILSGTGAVQDAGAYTIHVFRGVDSGTPLDVAAAAGGATNTRLANPTTITPTTAGAKILVVGSAAMGAGGTFTAAYLTDLRVTTQADTNDVNIASGYVDWTSGAYDPAAFGAGGTDTTSDSWCSMTVALRPLITTPFPDQRAAIRNGLDSAQSEGGGWDAKVKGNIPVANVVRTSDTVCTITLQAQADYDVTATETITATIPAAALTGAAQIVATPTFTVASGGSASMPAASGAFTWTGTAPTLRFGHQMPAVSGAYSWAGTAPALKTAHKFAGTSGTFTWSGTTVTFKRTYASLAATAGAYTWTGTAPTLTKAVARVMPGSTGTFTWAGTAVAFTRTYKLVGASGAYTWAGTAPTLKRTYAIAANAGAFTWTGTSPTLTKAVARSMPASAGAYTWTGTSPALTPLRSVEVFWSDIVGEDGYRVKWGTSSGTYPNSADVAANVESYTITGLTERTTYHWVVMGLLGGVEQTPTGDQVFTVGIPPLIADAGTFDWAGTAPTMSRTGAKVMVGTTAAFDWAGTAPVLRFAHKTPGTAGAFTWAGTAPVLTLRHVYSLAATAGAFTWAGTAPTLSKAGARTLSATAGAYDWIGTSPTLRFAHKMTGATGTFTWTGTAPSLKKARRITASAGAYTWTGTSPTLRFAHKMPAPSATFAWTGTAPALSKQRRLVATAGAFTWTGTAPTLKRPRRVMTATAGAFTLYGDVYLYTNSASVSGGGAVRRGRRPRGQFPPWYPFGEWPLGYQPEPQPDRPVMPVVYTMQATPGAFKWTAEDAGMSSTAGMVALRHKRTRAVLETLLLAA